MQEEKNQSCHAEIDLALKFHDVIHFARAASSACTISPSEFAVCSTVVQDRMSSWESKTDKDDEEKDARLVTESRREQVEVLPFDNLNYMESVEASQLDSDTIDALSVPGDKICWNSRKSETVKDDDERSARLIPKIRREQMKVLPLERFNCMKNVEDSQVKTDSRVAVSEDVTDETIFPVMEWEGNRLLKVLDRRLSGFDENCVVGDMEEEDKPDIENIKEAQSMEALPSNLENMNQVVSVPGETIILLPDNLPDISIGSGFD